MNGFVHVEIPTTDIEKSKKFYADVFGWKITEEPEMDYVMFQPQDGPGGGFTKRDYIGVGAVDIYIGVSSVDEMMRRIAAHGGVEVTPKTEIPGMGWYAFFRDPVGVKMGLYESARKEAPKATPAAKAARGRRVARKAAAPKKTAKRKPGRPKKVAKKAPARKVAKKAPAKKRGRPKKKR